MKKKTDISILPRVLFFWYITVFISTEFLSYLNLINRTSILLINILFSAVIIIFLGRAFKNFFQNILRIRSIYIIIAILGLTFLQGILSAPNTTDSMVRRLPIVMYWAQEHTLYQNIIRNDHDFMVPFTEYIFLHLYLIFNNDRMLFFSQWIAYAVTIILNFLIIRQLLGSQKTAIYSSLIAATLPMAILQATNVQMDMVTVVMVLFSIYFAFIFKSRPNVLNSFFLGSAVGLGILTKATYLIYIIFPIGILLPLIMRKWKKFLLLGMFIVILIVAIQARFVEQNLRLYGSVYGEGGKNVFINEFFAPQAMISNLIKNLIIQLPVPFGGKIVEQGIVYLHDKIGYSVNDPRTNYFDVKFSVSPVILPQEDRAGNPIHLIIILTAGMILIFGKKKLRTPSVAAYLYFLSIASFFLFSSILKWQPFHSRFLMPFFIVGSMVSTIILCSIERLKLMLNLLLAVSVILSLMIIAFNASKPFLSYTLFYDHVKFLAPPLSSIPQSIFTKEREEQYFNARFYLYEPYKEIMKMAASEKTRKTITFDLEVRFEYPLWYFLKKYNSPFKVVPFTRRTDETIIISTSVGPYYQDGYTTQCIKTKIDYGYVCLSKKGF